MPSFRQRSLNFAASFGAFLLIAPAGSAQEIHPPDYAQAALAGTAEEVILAWSKWRTGDSGLEQRVFRIPMTEAREIIARSLGRAYEFLDKRTAYTGAVATIVEARRLNPTMKGAEITPAAVYRDQIDLLGVNLSVLGEKKRFLRETTEWLAVRKSIDGAEKNAAAVQDLRRMDLPLDTQKTPVLKPIPVLTLRTSEDQVLQALRKLWTTYYQALIDAVEKNPNGPSPLVPIRPQGMVLATSALPPTPTFNAVENPLLGAWKYVEGSHLFNAAGEPREVLLELWMENGALQGRYRAELQDFNGPRKVDLRLRRTTASGGGQTTFTFDSYDPPASGRIVLEGPGGATGMELMVVRIPSTQSPIPRGREVLQRY